MIWGQIIMPPIMETHMAMEGAVLSASAPPAMRETALAPMNIELMAIRKDGPIFTMAGVSSGSFARGGSSTL